MRLRPGLRSGPRWESLERSPDPLAGLKGPIRSGRGKVWYGGEGKEGKWRRGAEREGRGGQVDSDAQLEQGRRLVE